MKKEALDKFRDGCKTVWIVCCVAVAASALLILMNLSAKAEEIEERWILCNPNSYVCMRAGPRRKAEVVGYLYAGDRIETDGKIRNGWLHLANVLNEINDGWVKLDYVSIGEPEINEKGWSVRVLKKSTRVRASIGGRVIRRLKKGTVLTCYAMSLDWSLTSMGYIKTELLEDVEVTASDKIQEPKNLL